MNFPVDVDFPIAVVFVTGAALDGDVLVVPAVVVVVPQVGRLALLQRLLVAAA